MNHSPLLIALLFLFLASLVQASSPESPCLQKELVAELLEAGEDESKQPKMVKINDDHTDSDFEWLLGPMETDLGFPVDEQEQGEVESLTFVFASCHRTGRRPEQWDQIRAQEPRAVLLLGDNIYSDTEDMEELAETYTELQALPQFAALRQEAEIWATWDDHDYGLNDSGEEYSQREGSKAAFVKNYDFLPEDPIHKRELGIWHARTVEHAEKTIQFLFLDTRSFRSPLKKDGKWYIPDESVEKTMLGEEQWAWLEAELAKPTDWRILCSSIQVIASEHRFEKWANLPKEQDKLLAAIAQAKGGKTVILSGDRHMCEVSVLQPDQWPGDYPLYDITSSGLTHANGGFPDEKNTFRLGERSQKRNFGSLSFGEDGSLKIQLHFADDGEPLKEIPSTQLFLLNSAQ